MIIYDVRARFLMLMLNSTVNKSPLNIAYTPAIHLLSGRYCSVGIPILLICHGRGEYSSHPW